VDRVFDCSAQRLVAHLLEHEELSPDERQELADLLRQGKRRKPGAGEPGGPS
jgi:predicted transcriptional regulator